jgi:hypothetical protein
MRSRVSSLLLLYLAVAGYAKNASVYPVALQVQVYDYAGLRPADILDFVTRTEHILAGSGISVEVDACGRGLSTPCASRHGNSKQVVIRVLDVIAQKSKHDLGESIVSRDGGTYGTVFLRAAQDKAAEANVPRLLVLAYAAAHEVGHLLLGNEAHTSRGLMKARWTDDDFEAMAQSRLHFSREQVQELTRRYGRGRPAEIGADNSIVARR